MRGAQGPIETLSSFASAHRIFSVVEVPVALNTPTITTIGGLKRQDLVDYRASLVQKGQSFNQATAHIADLIAWESRLRSQEIPIALNSEKNSISWASVSKWTNVPATSIPKGVTAQPYRKLAGPLPDSDITHIRNILHTVERTGLNATYWRTAASAGKTLGGIGGALATASLAIAAHDAYQAHQAGNSAQAGKIMATWTGSLAGGALLGSLAYQGSVALLAPLAALGVVGIGMGVGTALLSSLIAGYFGAKGGAALGDKLITQLQTLFNQTENTVSPLITELDFATLKYELIQGTPGNNYINGQGLHYPLRIDGGAGNDILKAGDKDTILIGGPGNDELYLSQDINTVIYHLGDGQDVVEYLYSFKTGEVNCDTLQLGPGITPDNTQLVRGLEEDSNNLTLIFADGGQVLLKRYFDSDCQLSTIRFTNGAEWKIEQVMLFLTYRGTADNDYLRGLDNYANRIDGGAGDDTIKAADKDDILIGGRGNDQLYLGAGTNTVIYHLGDGQDIVYEETRYNKTGGVNRDTLQLGPGITPDNTQLVRGLKYENDLTLIFADGGQVRLRNYFSPDDQLSTIRFANSAEWKIEQVIQLLTYRGTADNDYLRGLWYYANRIDGGAGDDTIKAGPQDGVLIGGAGNDQLYLGEGINTVIYHLGDGQDTLHEESQYFKTGKVNRDILQLGPGITPDNTQLVRGGLGGDDYDLTLIFADAGQVRLRNYFSPDYQLSTIRFARVC